MAALKNRTVETEVLESFKGKTVKFEDDGQELTGEVTSVTTDGFLLVDIDESTQYQLEPHEITVVDDNGESESDEVEEHEEEPEEVDEEEVEEVEGIETSKEKPTKEDVEETILEKNDEELMKETDAELLARIEGMSLTQVKFFIRENAIKGIPLVIYQNESKLKNIVIEKLGLLKPIVEKKKEAFKKEKIKTTKEKKVKVVKEKKPRKVTLVDQICAEVINSLKEKSMTKKELFEATNKDASDMTRNFCINFVITVTNILGILKTHEGNKFSL